MIERKANINDIPQLLEVTKSFLLESQWGWTYNEANSINSFLLAITHDDMDVIVVDDSGIKAVSVLSTESDFTNEIVGDIVEFYVMPDARGTGAGRALLKASCDWFDEKGCVNVFVKATANIGNDTAFINLFKKYNFNVFSKVLVR